MTLRVGILAEKDCAVFPWSDTQAVLQAADADLIWFREVLGHRSRKKVGALFDRAVFRVLTGIEGRGRSTPYLRYQPPSPVDLPCHLADHFKVFSPDALKILHEHSLDLLLRLGGRGIYRDAVIDIARLGMVSVHHGDNRKYRGGPPGFWEVVNGDDACGYVVQRLTPVLDGGDVLARGSVLNHRSMTANQQALFNAADPALAKVMQHVVETGELPEAEVAMTKTAPITTIPNMAGLLRYATVRMRA